MTYNEYKQQFINSLPQFLGHDKLLSQRDKDQGDTLQRVGTMFTLLFLLEDQELIQAVAKYHPSYERSMSLLMKSPGVYVRSSDPNAGWQNDVYTTSRDQLAIAKTAMASGHDTHRLKQVLVAQLKRLTFHQNYYEEGKYHFPDIMAPTEPAVFARGLLRGYSRVITPIFDLFFLTDIATRNASELNRWSEDNMLAQSLLFACHRYPSFVAKFAMYLYKKTNFMERLKAYHLDFSNGCDPLYYLYRMAFLKLENY